MVKILLKNCLLPALVIDFANQTDLVEHDTNTERKRGILLQKLTDVLLDRDHFTLKGITDCKRKIIILSSHSHLALYLVAVDYGDSFAVLGG